MNAGKSPILAASESYHAYWQEAGYTVQCVDEAVSWLNDVHDDATDFDTYVRSLEVAEKSKSLQSAPTHNLAEVRPATPDLPALPNTISVLAEIYPRLSEITNRPCLAPIGTGREFLCIITDMPTQVDAKAGQYFSGEDGVLLSNMLKAIGLTRSAVFITAAIPFFSAANDHDKYGEYLTSLLRRQLSLIGARHILVLGDAGSRFLLNETSLKMRGRLHDINHDNGHMSLSTSFHPLGLLKRPEFKRMAWQDLQLVAKAIGTL
jgi:uracil-DNA glycosylase